MTAKMCCITTSLWEKEKALGGRIKRRRLHLSAFPDNIEINVIDNNLLLVNLMYPETADAK